MQKGFAVRRASMCGVLITFYVQSFKRKITNTSKNRAHALMLMMWGFKFETLNMSLAGTEHHSSTISVEGGPTEITGIYTHTRTHTRSADGQTGGLVMGRKTDREAPSHGCANKTFLWKFARAPVRALSLHTYVSVCTRDDPKLYIHVHRI